MRVGLILGLLGLVVGCGPAVSDGPDSDGGSEGSGVADTDDTGAEGETEADPGTSEGSAGGSGSTSEGEPPELDGITVQNASHSYSCISSGCDGGYSYKDDRLSLEITADHESDVVVQWHDWTITDRELVVGAEPIDETTVHLEPGVPTEVDLEISDDGYCDVDAWSEPGRVLLLVDDIPIEVEAHSSGGGGEDHC